MIWSIISFLGHEILFLWWFPVIRFEVTEEVTCVTPYFLDVKLPLRRDFVILPDDVLFCLALIILHVATTLEPCSFSLKESSTAAL
jgi:hypothetical protein